MSTVSYKLSESFKFCIQIMYCIPFSYCLTGSFESTFAFRIREDRQLMGFSKESTFNQLCGVRNDKDDPSSCDPPTYWKMPDEIHFTQPEAYLKKSEL